MHPCFWKVFRTGGAFCFVSCMVMHGPMFWKVFSAEKFPLAPLVLESFQKLRGFEKFSKAPPWYELGLVLSW
jgi:hypothetical protein